jgi:hypothetical protein
MATGRPTDGPNEMINDLAEGYARMLTRVRERLAEAEAHAPLPLYMVIEEAREQAVAVGEMTQAEAEQVTYWLKQDLVQLREVLQRTERGVMTWLGLDLRLIEQGLLDILADPTRVDWVRLQQDLESTRQRSGHPSPQGKQR